MKCNQCGRPAIAQVGDNPLCVDCSLKLQQALDLQNARQARELNSLLGQFEDTVGMPGLFQRHQVPPPLILQTGPTTLNHIHVDRSVVGAINTGDIKKLDVVMDHIKAGGDAASAETLQKMIQAVIDSTEFQTATKNEILEHLSFISAQAILPKERRQSSVARTSLVAVEKLLSASANLVTLWMGVKPIMDSFLN
jgi:hypothetical protein